MIKTQLEREYLKILLTYGNSLYIYMLKIIFKSIFTFMTGQGNSQK